MVCFQGWAIAGLARVVGRREVRAMEREKRGTERVKARRDSIVAVNDMNPGDVLDGESFEEEKNAAELSR
jgi:hypothetical protein